MKKNLLFIVKARQEYIRSFGKFADDYAVELNSFFESISDLYIPLLNLSKKIESQNIPARFGVVLPPVLCTMLSDMRLQSLYVEWLDKRIALGEKEIVRCKQSAQALAAAERTLQKYLDDKKAFCETFEKNLVKAFAEFHKKGIIELLGTCGTDIFIPHYADLPEVISAQIETGLVAYRTFFSDTPDGFWLPELGYIPGIEKLVRAYGYSYTVLDAKSLLLAKDLPSKGIFYPVRTENSLVLFANDPDLKELFVDEKNIIRNEVYRNENHDIGFELSASELSPVIGEKGLRCSTGYKYWNKRYGGGEDSLYDEAAAFEQAKKEARAFLLKKSEELSRAAEILQKSDYVSLTCALDAAALHQNWHEFMTWFEEVITSAADYDLNLITGNALLKKQFTLEKINPYYSAFCGGGYGENLLSSKNCWMMRYVRKSSERMIDLADRFPNDTGLKNRLLNIGAKELLLSQSTGLSKMIDENLFPEFADERFRQSISAFTAVFDSLGSNVVSTEWLTKLEERDNLFPWMNYRIFSKKQ